MGKYHHSSSWKWIAQDLRAAWVPTVILQQSCQRTLLFWGQTQGMSLLSQAKLLAAELQLANSADEQHLFTN